MNEPMTPENMLIIFGHNTCPKCGEPFKRFDDPKHMLYGLACFSIDHMFHLQFQYSTIRNRNRSIYTINYSKNNQNGIDPNSVLKFNVNEYKYKICWDRYDNKISCSTGEVFTSPINMQKSSLADILTFFEAIPKYKAFL